MIGKDKLLLQIDKVARQEEELIPLLNRHISSALFFSGLDQRERDKIIDRFQEMVIKQREHISILNEMKKEIREGGTNVY